MVNFRTWIIVHGAFFLLACGLAEAGESIAALVKVTVEPAALTLSHSRFGHRLLVTGFDKDGRAVDLTPDVVWSSNDSVIAEVQSSRVWPRGDGQTVVSAEVAGMRLEVPVRVQGFQPDPAVHFRLELEPILSKAGCNGGSCHGAQYGKGGFKLSLFGGDPSIDHDALARGSFGRRANMLRPSASLLLLKATAQVGHGGGQRLPRGAREYETFEHWIADGCPNEKETTSPRVVSLEVLPRERAFAHRDGRQTILVIANLSDGSKRDVTQDCRFDSNTPNIVSVDRDGRVSALDYGEGVVMVRYLDKVDVARFLSIPDDPSFTWTGQPVYNFIDELVDAKLKKMHFVPSPLCSDEEFVRRASLDAIGTLPTVEELDAFLADPNPAIEKRRKYVDDLLSRPEFATYWTQQWDDWLHNHGRLGSIKAMLTLRNWVHDGLRNHKPMDQFATELITSHGNTYREGPANFYRLHEGADNLAEAFSGIFLGVHLECAKCHQHPFEKWTQDDYYALSAYFARVQKKIGFEYGSARGIYSVDWEIYLNPFGGEVFHPRTRKVMVPTPLGASQPSEDVVDRRRALARWLTDPSNPLFARNLVNRHWAHFMGRGLVEPVDDMRDTNPPTNPELLDALARDLVAHGFDLHHLFRTIMNSRTYQLSSRAVAGNKADATYYSRYYARRLHPEPLLDAICVVTGVPEEFPETPAGTRAIALPAVMSAEVKNYFLDVFGRPQRTFDKCECQRATQPNLAQVLHLINGDWLHGKVTSASGRLPSLLKDGKSDHEIIVTFYRSAFGRRPSDVERQAAVDQIALAPTRQEGLEDLLWSLCNCKEFLFNH